MIFHPVVVILLLLTFVVQEFIPGIEIAQFATLFLPPVFFFTASVAVPFPIMLMLAFGTGFLWDARHLQALSHAVGEAAELLGDGGGSEFTTGLGMPFGISIVFFAFLGTMLQGIRPSFKRGRLEFPVVMVGLATFSWMLMQYIVISFLRGSLDFDPMLWTKMITGTLLSMLAAPLLFLLLYSLARLSSYEIKYEGLRYRFDGR